MFICDICQFYGYPLEYVQNLSVQKYNYLREGMVKLRARFKLNDFEVASYPYVDKKARSQKANMLKHVAMTRDEIKRKVVKDGDFDKIYGEMGSIDAVLNSKD